MPGNERTVSFALWPHVVTLEGPAETLAAFVELLYDDARIPREGWSLATASGLGRRAMAERLRFHGKRVRRIGVAALTLPVCEQIVRRAQRAGVKFSEMHLPEARPENHLQER
jgi:hypothetical protein